MKDTLHFIVSTIVNNPDSVEIIEEERDGIIQLEIKIPKEEIGRVIGKEGKIIRSIRNIMKIKAMKHNARINITLAEA